jgi:hypothetical protein
MSRLRFKFDSVVAPMLWHKQGTTNVQLTCNCGALRSVMPVSLSEERRKELAYEGLGKKYPFIF